MLDRTKKYVPVISILTDNFSTFPTSLLPLANLIPFSHDCLATEIGLKRFLNIDLAF